MLLTWSQVAEADFDHFEVWEHTEFTAAPASVATRLVETWHADWQRTGLFAGAARYWWVRAVDRHGNRGGFSAPASATIPGTPSYALLLE